jgi:hypothetical protein
MAGSSTPKSSSWGIEVQEGFCKNFANLTSKPNFYHPAAKQKPPCLRGF